jgi:hypothetical protein
MGAANMSRNTLYVIIGALAVAVAVLGYLLYQEQQKTAGIEINLGNGGISVETR